GGGGGAGGGGLRAGEGGRARRSRRPRRPHPARRGRRRGRGGGAPRLRGAGLIAMAGVGYDGRTRPMLNAHVLVLNHSYLPIHVTSVRRAFSLIYQDVARALDEGYQAFDIEARQGLSTAGGG